MSSDALDMANPSPMAGQRAAWSDTQSMVDTTAAAHENLALRCLLDIDQRTALGIWVYPGMWLLVCVFTGLTDLHPWLAWGHVAGLFGLSVVRYGLHRRLPQLLHSHFRATAFAFRALTLLIALYWGGLTGLCIVSLDDHGAAWIMLVLMVAFCGGGNALFAIDRTLRYPYPLALVLPVVACQALQDDPTQQVMLGLELALLLYLRRSSAIVYADYWEARRARRQLARQALALQRASLTDGLTQVHNRVAFDRLGEREWRRHQRDGQPLAVVMVDLDHFKRINDTHGHPAGDRCLQAVSAALAAACTRAGDVVARYGGEEFVVLLPATDAGGAVDVAERLARDIRALRLDVHGTPLSLTCSIGVCARTPDRDAGPDAPGLAALIQSADEALYRAKREGRDRVVLGR
ncbi:GGDEF domain-containing protein [Pseudaquabacterium rugosum]|uniref:diguanylate cyclase n=1 Tax=Pseudaquabacterium rugosum TaxID=2984194 RepID=A0ABU9BAB3_9BURK